MTEMNETNETDTTPIPPSRVNYWRIATILCVIMLAVGAAAGMGMLEQFRAQITHLQTKLKFAPQIKYVAVLMDDQHVPGQLITFDPQDAFLQIQRLTDLKEGREQSLQLWALDKSNRPLSLGVLPPSLMAAQVRTDEKILSQAVSLVVSVEERGGVDPDRPPNKPYLFTGLLIKKAQ